ncbi:MAG: zinc-dependent metalloprotease family protein [Flavobacteriaceae bacterium]
MKTKNLLLLLIILFSSNLFAQNHFTKTTLKNADKIIFVKTHTPTNFSLYQLAINSLKSDLHYIENHKNINLKNSETIITLPTLNGKTQRFKLIEDAIMSDKLAKKFPMIKTYLGQGIDDPTATLRISIGTDGFHAMILAADKASVFIDPYTKNRNAYILYSSADLPKLEGEFSCEFENEEGLSVNSTPITTNKNATDGKRREYDLAIACTIEYSAFHLTNQGVAASATTAVKKAAVLSAIVNTVNRVQQIYEKEIAVRFNLIDNNDDIIFIDADNFTNSSGGTLINESQTEIDAVIGNANYDIGHTFSTGGGGLASLGGICTTDQTAIYGVNAVSRKARAITGSPNPIGDFYDVDYVAHEMGHHFGANHTYNADGFGSCTTRVDDNSAEPGGGTTIMAYAGICPGANVQQNSDAYFHILSLTEINDRLHNLGGFTHPYYQQCGVEINTGNNEPTVDTGFLYTIPKGTAFVLYGAGTDPDGDAVTYNWEQMDNEFVAHPLVSTHTEGPAYRSYPATVSPNRYMPKFETVFGGSLATSWEVTPTVARTLTFNLTTRDNNPIGGQTNSEDTEITVSGVGPFAVTSQATEEIWATGETQTINWDVAGTDANDIDVDDVKICLVDATGTELAVLLASTPNNGSATITVPNITNSNVKVMVKAIDNIFYALNSAVIAINDVPAYCNTLCSSTGSTQFPDGTTLVQFNTINIASTGDDAYTDFTAISTDVTIGETYPLTVHANTDGGFVEATRVWIDWNRDCDFDDANEQYDLGSTFNSPTTGAISSLSPLAITVPANAIIGDTRMRVTSSYSDTNNPLEYKDDCDTGFLGEVEDYTINILPAANCTGDVCNWDGNAWTPNAPTINDTAIIDGAYNYATNGDIDSCELTINSGITITIPAGSYMLAEHDIVNNGTIIVEHEGSIVQIDDDATVTGNDFQIQKTTTEYVEYDYTYWSSPIENADIATVFAANTASRIYDFTTANFLDTTPVNTYDDDNNDWNIATGTMTKGKGYIVMGEGAVFPFHPSGFAQNLEQNISFNGKINNGVVTYPVTLDGGSDNFENENLIGNPYPSAIDATAFLAANPNLNNTIWLWTHATALSNNGNATANDDEAYNFSNSDYATWTVGTGGTAANGSALPTGKIASGQAFFVSLKQASGNGNVNFNNSMRVNTGNDNFYRPTSNSERVWVNMTGDKGLFRQILVGFIPGATSNIETLYDGKRMFIGDDFNFYSVINNQKFAVQGLAPLSSTNITVPLGITVKEIGDLTIAIDHFDTGLDNVNIYLKDNLLNVLYDLKLNDYIFNANQLGDNNTRFELIFSRNTLNTTSSELTSQSNLIINNQDNNIHLELTTGEKIAHVTAYDILGKTIISSTKSDIENHIDKGTILIFKVTLENGQTLTKKFLKL